MRGRKWLAVGTAVAVIVAAALVVKYIVAPAAIRARIAAAVEENWDGAVSIRQVRFRYFGPDRLDGVILTDRRDRPWIEADRVWLSAGRRHAISPSPGRIEARTVNISLYLDEDGLTLPLKDTNPLLTNIPADTRKILASSAVLTQPNHGPRPGKGAGHTAHTATPPGGLSELVVHDLQATAFNNGRSFRILEDAAVALEHRLDHYGLLVFEKDNALWQTLALGGRIRTDNGHSAIKVQASRNITPDEGAFLITALHGPRDWSGGGFLEVNATLSGPVARPTELVMRGMARLDGWSLSSGRHAAIKDLNMHVNIDGHRYDISGLACTLYGACVKAQLWAQIDPAQLDEAAFGGKLIAKGISVKDIAREIGAPHRTAGGTASAKINFAVNGGIDDLRGDAVLLFEDTSLLMFPLSHKIIEGMGLPIDDPSEACAFACAFDFSGPAGVIRQGRFANSAVIMETRPGGIMNAATGEVDLHVLARPLADAPDARPDTEPDDNLLHLRVKGNYWDAASRLITHQPLDHVSKETAAFLRSPLAPRKTANCPDRHFDPNELD